MPYYPTLAEDVARAKAILAKGKPSREDYDHFETMSAEVQAYTLAGGAISGADIYAAYKLLESFVEAIEADVKVVELEVAKARLWDAIISVDAIEHTNSLENSGELHERIDRIGAELAARERIIEVYEAQLAKADQCVCRTRGCGHAARLHVGGICQACKCEGWS